MMYGFRKAHSTIHPIIHFVNHVANANNNNEFTIGIFVDLTKAFDTVNHSILFKKLQYYGIRGVALDWFRSYLSGRQQCVAIGGSLSSFKPINIGVPQGSILGPILFLLYINDLPNATSLLPFLFSDDTTCVKSGGNLPLLFREVNLEFQKLGEWFRANKLSLHPGKTKYSIFCNPEKKLDMTGLDLFFNNNDVDNLNPNPELIKPLECIHSKSQLPAIKFLGLYLDQFLNFKFHINKICGKLASALFCIRRCKHLLSDSALKTLYFSMFHAIRLISKAHYNSHTEPLFKKMEVLKFDDLYKSTQVEFMHCYLNSKLPLSFEGVWSRNRDNKSVTLRNSSEIFIPPARLAFSDRLPLHSIPRVYNEFPDINIKNIFIPKKFKNELKQFYLNNLSSEVFCGRPFCQDCYYNYS